MGGGFDQRPGTGGQRGPHGAISPGLDPGKRTLVEQLEVQRSAAVQRKPDDAPAPQQPEGAHVDRLIHLLAAPAAAGRDDAYMLLSSLDVPELLAVMEGVADRGYLAQLAATWPSSTPA